MIHSINSLLAATLIAAVGCNASESAPGDERPLDIVGAGDSTLVSVTRVTGGVRISNGTEAPIAYMVWNRGYLAMFAPCIDTSAACVRLPAGAAVTVPYSQVEGATAAMTEAIVRWWHVIPDGQGGYRASQIKEVVVPL